MDHFLITAKNSKYIIVGVKADELVKSHKGKTPIIDAYERAEILRHFCFVNDVYIYYTRNLHVANDWIKSRYGREVSAVFLGSDLKEDFSKVEGINIIFTERPEKINKMRQTSGLITLIPPKFITDQKVFTGESITGQLENKKEEKTQGNQDNIDLSMETLDLHH